MVPETRDEFSEYCLRALGDGVIQINVSPDQIEDRIDEAIYLFQQFHMDAVAKVYVAHEVTGTTFHFHDTPGIVGNFVNNEFFKCEATGVSAVVTSNTVVDDANVATHSITGFYALDQQ